MKFKLSILITIIFIFKLHFCVYPQTNKPFPMLKTPGDNKNFSLSDIIYPMIRIPSFIVWINHHDSVYSVLLKKYNPNDSSVIIVASGKNPMVNPKIFQKGNENGLRITWQAYDGKTWKLYLRNYLDNSLSNDVEIIDTIYEAQPYALSKFRIAWVNNGRLKIKDFETDNSLFVFNGDGYSEPVFKSNVPKEFASIMYIKKDSTGSRLYYADYNSLGPTKWVIKFKSPDSLCANPSFGYIFNDIAYKTYKDSVWKVAITKLNDSVIYYTDNYGFNFNNPLLSTAPILIKSKGSRDFYYYEVLFDSDSLKGNKEIFTYHFYGNSSRFVYNISNSAGIDEKPQLTGYNENGKCYATYLWEHTENGRTDIWRLDELTYSDVEPDITKEKTFRLMQNYPNPFNPSTRIAYELKKAGYVSIRIYNCLGQLVSTAVNEFKTAGAHNIDFNGAHLSSGCYFYEISVDDFKEVKSMLLLK